MKALTIFLFIAFMFFVIAWRLFSYFAYKVPVLEVLVQPFLWIWIGSLIAAVVFSVLLILKEFNKHKSE